jgi:hypothetical protein
MDLESAGRACHSVREVSGPHRRRAGGLPALPSGAVKSKSIDSSIRIVGRLKARPLLRSRYGCQTPPEYQLACSERYFGVQLGLNFVGSIICEARCNIQHPTPNAERWFPAWSYRVTEVKDSALLARIPAMWDVSDPRPRCSYRATWRDETNSFVPSGFLFLPVWEFQRKLDSAPERSEYPARAPCLIANQTVHSLLARPALQPLAFLPG